MSENDASGQRDLVRTQDFAVDGPIELDVTNGGGNVTIELTDSADGTVHVEVRHAPHGVDDWNKALDGLLSWVNKQFGETGLGAGTEQAPATEAVRQTRVDLTGNRLVVRAPQSLGLRGVPLAITVTGPADCPVSVRSGSGNATVTGPAGPVSVQSGSGAVSVENVTGKATLRSGSGALRLGSATEAVHARSGNGEIEIAGIAAASSVATGSGSVWLGAVDADVLVRSGSGSVTIADAGGGQTELISGSGNVRVAVRQESFAEVDLTSSTGTASSDLLVEDTAPDETPTFRVFARSGSGDVLVTSAV
ncbi:DUF4097 family beta strand repeat protein [Allosaccharopolyspora coralli]|uniref:DUF4097 family beta strand repeat protein n=1 Tax=Allosaccharopolyspora coralli TaxID=2665642 RepID=A0A5Q3Q8D7_9PSEU|nr:DUF4097 family beta strand repeat-containing protein [Allosaccharopolyspora coralli]QGK70931.1 DUF4097 family beta strand repeat protein [Allosaccharopolyspora coralli]